MQISTAVLPAAFLRLLLFSLCGDTMGRSASARKVCGASQPAFQKVKSVDDILAVEAIAPAGSSGDLAWSVDDTAAVEEHAEGGHFTTLTDSGSSFVDRDHMYHEGRGYPLGT